MKKSQLTHVSFCSGIGGFEIGAQKAGVKNLAAVEMEKFCCDVLRNEFPKLKVYEQKIETINPAILPKADIYSAGFPCQDISLTNPDAVGIDGNKSKVFFVIAEIIRKNRPRYVIIENSTMLIDRGLDKILCFFAQIGYDAEWTCLRASDFGYSHIRERLFLVAYPNSYRREYEIFQFEKIETILRKWETIPIDIPITAKAVTAKGDYKDLCGDNEFPKNFGAILKAYGNAVMPIITYWLFSCIIDFDEKLKIYEKL